MMLLRLVALAFFITVIPVEKAVACSCIKGTPEMAIKATPIIAMAEVFEHIKPNKVRLRFTEVWKGKAPKEKEAILTVGTRSDCSPVKTIQPEIGTQYILYFDFEINPDKPLAVRFQGCNNNGAPNSEDLARLNEYKKTLNEFDSIFQNIWDAKSSKIRKANFLVEHRDYVNAYDIYESLIQSYEKDIEVLTGFSELLFKMGKNIRSYGTPEQKDKSEKEKQGYFERALGYAKTVISVDPSNKIANSTRIKALALLNKKIDGDLDDTDISGITIYKQKFDGVSANKTKFKSTKLNSVSFENMKFDGSEFDYSKLSKTNFLNSKIINSSFYRSEIKNVTDNENGLHLNGFEEITIENSNFENAIIGVPIVNAKINKSNFKGAIIHNGQRHHILTKGGEVSPTLLHGVIVNNTDFNKAKIIRSALSDGVVKDSVFINSSFEKATIAVDILNTDFSQSNLTGVSLIGSRFDCRTKWPKGFDPTLHGAISLTSKCGNTQYTRPNFEGASAVEARLWSMNLEGANFRNAKLQWARFDNSNLKDAVFERANLHNAMFSGANLNGANLSGTTLIGTNFYNTSLVNADLTNAQITNSQFFGADLSGANLNGAKLKVPHFKGAFYSSKTLWPEGFDYQSSGAILKE